MGTLQTAADVGDMSPWSPEQVGFRERSIELMDRAREFRNSPAGRNIELAVVVPVMWVGSLGYFTGALALKGARPIAKGVKERALDIAAVFSEQRGDNIEPASNGESEPTWANKEIDMLKSVLGAAKRGSPKRYR